MDVASPVEIAAKPQRAALFASIDGKKGEGTENAEEFTLNIDGDVAFTAPNVAEINAKHGRQAQQKPEEVSLTEADESSEAVIEQPPLPANEETPVALPGHAPPAELITGVAQAQAKVLPETQQIAPERSAQAALHVPPEAAQTATFAAPVHKTQLVAVPNTNRSALPAPDTREPVAFVQTETAGENQAPAKVVAQSEMATIKAAPPLTLPLPLPLAAPPGELTVRVQEHSAPVQFGWSDPLTTGSLAKILPLVPGAPDAQRARHVAAQLAITVRSSESSSMELRLDPPELGRVLIQMTTQEGELRAIVTTERAETAELMRRHADILGRELARAGLAGADLSFQSEAEQRQNQRMAESKAIKPLAEISSNHAANLSGVVVQTHLDGRLDIRL